MIFPEINSEWFELNSTHVWHLGVDILENIIIMHGYCIIQSSSVDRTPGSRPPAPRGPGHYTIVQCFSQNYSTIGLWDRLCIICIYRHYAGGRFPYTLWRKLHLWQNWGEVNIVFVHGIPMKMGEVWAMGIKIVGGINAPVDYLKYSLIQWKMNFKDFTPDAETPNRGINRLTCLIERYIEIKSNKCADNTVWLQLYLS